MTDSKSVGHEIYGVAVHATPLKAAKNGPHSIMRETIGCLGQVCGNVDRTRRETHPGQAFLRVRIVSEDPIIRVANARPYPLATKIASGKEGSRRNGDDPALISLFRYSGSPVNHGLRTTPNELFNHARCALRANSRHIPGGVHGRLISLSPKCPRRRIRRKTVQRGIHAKKGGILLTQVNVTVVTALRLATLGDSVVGDRCGCTPKNSYKLASKLTVNVLLNLFLNAFGNATFISYEVKVSCHRIGDFACIWLWQGPGKPGEGQARQGVFVNARAEPSLNSIWNARNKVGFHLRQDVPSERHSQVLQLGTSVVSPVAADRPRDPIPGNPTAPMVGDTERDKTKPQGLPNQVVARRLDGLMTFTTLTIAGTTGPSGPLRGRNGPGLTNPPIHE
jgi:hypothetical protein